MFETAQNIIYGLLAVSLVAWVFVYGRFVYHKRRQKKLVKELEQLNHQN